jgi:hypothetical protein
MTVFVRKAAELTQLLPKASKMSNVNDFFHVFYGLLKIYVLRDFNCVVSFLSYTYLAYFILSNLAASPRETPI